MVDGHYGSIGIGLKSLAFSLMVSSFSFIYQNNALAQTNSVPDVSANQIKREDVDGLLTKLRREADKKPRFHTEFSISIKNNNPEPEDFVGRAYWQLENRRSELNSILKDNMTLMPWMFKQKPKINIGDKSAEIKLYEWKSDNRFNGDRIRMTFSADYDYGHEAKVLFGVKIPLPE